MKRALVTIVLLSTCFAAAAARARTITVQLPAPDASAEAEVGLYDPLLCCLPSVSAQGSTITIDVEKLAGACDSGNPGVRPIEIRQLYSGSRLVLRQERDKP